MPSLETYGPDTEIREACPVRTLEEHEVENISLFTAFATGTVDRARDALRHERGVAEGEKVVPAGCCRGTEYRGRTGIYEFSSISDDLRDELSRFRRSAHLRRHATAAGMRSLREDGLRLVWEGVISLEEVIRLAAH